MKFLSKWAISVLMCVCYFSFGFADSDTNGTQKTILRILVGSPIRQKPSILKEFLQSLDRLEKNSYKLDYFFVDDNVIEESRQLLLNFQKSHPSCLIENPLADTPKGEYVCSEITHNWKEDTIWKVALFKDRMIEKARNDNYDYLFLIDSDIVLHPHTIEQLLLAKKDIVSNIFWTKWYPTSAPEPQVWLTDSFNHFVVNEGERLSSAQMQERRESFLAKLHVPGVYEVGGLGACTLISNYALHKGISFKKMKNLSFWGEDRHFCVRAVALGLSLFVDTHLPACHIYRESALCGVSHYTWACEHHVDLPLLPSPRLTLSMVVKNEADRYLRRVLESARRYITDAVIIDDASTDSTVDVCKEMLKGIPLHLVQNSESKFSNEITLRKQQWEETIKTNPDWIIFLDADEIFEKAFEDQVQNLILDNDADVYSFRLFDFWDEDHFRDDQYWSAHTRYSPFLLRYRPEVRYHWRETPQHCGRMPRWDSGTLHERGSQLRLKHYGWANPENRLAKYHRYMQLDPGARYGWKEQYESILDPNPNLVAWKE